MTLKIVMAQLNVTVGAIEKNTQHIIDSIKTAAAQDQADLIIFPELCITGYPPEDLLYRSSLFKRTQKALDAICDISTTVNVGIIVGFPERIAEKTYNTAAFICNGKVVGKYHKQDLPNYTVFDEKRYFTPGNKPYLFTLKNCKIAIIICEDLWHSGPAEQAAKAGAQLIVSLNASPYDRYKVKARENILRERAQATHLPILYVNLVGGQDELVFDGGSMAVNANGERVQQGAYYREDLIVVDIEQQEKQLMAIPQPLPAHLSEEENVYQTLVLAVKDYVNKNHFPGAVLGLSGGIDSALTLAIAVDALGAERVTTIMMPSQFTASISQDDAKQQADTLEVKYHTITIGTVFSAFLQSLAPLFNAHEHDKTEENIQARIRGTLLMAYSNKFGNIVLTTGNKSEMSVGYATLYGDMAGGFAVLKDIPKTLVYRLANYRNAISPVIPERVITRAPTAELAPNQTDQDSLPAYEVLDEIIERYVNHEQSIEDIIAAGFAKDEVQHIVKLINRNEYKRRQAPVGVRISQHAYGKDRRYPITSGF